MTQTSGAIPRPFLVLNQYYVCRYRPHKNWRVRLREICRETIGLDRFMSPPNMDDIVSEESIKTGRFYENAWIYDVHCQKYRVEGFELKGLYRNLWNLWGLMGRRQHHYEFIVGEPQQLTFEQARDEIVEHICSRRWVGQTGGTPASFRKLQASKRNMAEFMQGISFYGKWPF